MFTGEKYSEAIKKEPPLIPSNGIGGTSHLNANRDHTTKYIKRVKYKLNFAFGISCSDILQIKLRLNID